MKALVGARFTALVVVLVVCAAGPAARAATFVVDQGNSAASDENPGTEEKPWKTIQYATGAVKAGDTLCVMEGQYKEQVKLARSGAEGKPITLRAVPPRAVTVEGFDTGGASHLRIQGFRVTRSDAASKTPGIEVAAGSTDIEILDNLVEGIYMGISGGAKNVRCAYNRIYRTQFGMVIGSSSEKWLIESNEIERQFQHRSGDCDYSRLWGKDHVVRYNRYHGTLRAEIGQAHLDCVQSFNVKKDNPGTFLHHLTFEDNMCTTFSQAFMMSTSTPGTHHHMTFRRNVFWSGGAWGLCLSKLPDMVSEHNTFAQIKWYGFGNAGGQDGVATANLFSAINTPYTRGPGFSGKRNLVHNCENDPKDAGPDEFFKGDPKFADFEKGNLRLTAGSAAIDAGPGGSDIGALEYPNVYYVDPRHPGASDDGFGYAGWPFKTAAAALAMARSGETVVLREGTYRELLKPAQGNITVRAMGDEKVVISGADLVAGWKRDGQGWSAPLPRAPERLLRDGQPWTAFTYDAGAKTLRVAEGGDARLHVFETVVRPHAADLTSAKGGTLEGLEFTNTLGSATIIGDR